eukprot:157608-Prorocentrum_minimum.AAC.2
MNFRKISFLDVARPPSREPPPGYRLPGGLEIRPGVGARPGNVRERQASASKTEEKHFKEKHSLQREHGVGT